ncbi:hypothetical protein QTN47_18775 [Danxiaibacter flavus]|uniref:Uncharacterized protein n=1 Tax=Danxiaibacter flavus TaxID=3049108 RepID=A0ABV3ZJ71_9BACT|nr:hypothetical protein QNM32_18785 [Chitinophagaceae bacterium DXS]
MKTQYQIECNIRITDGYVELARFQISDSKEDALELFSQLKGALIAEKPTPAIRMHLVDTGQPLETVLAARYCTLCEAKDNFEIITKETFRAINIG